MSLSRAVPPPALLVPVSDILAAVAPHALPLAPRRLPVAQAVGGVVAEALVVGGPVPDASVALHPGYAVASSDLVGISAYSPLLVAQVPPWVEAGAVLPDGTDAILPSDAVERNGAVVEIVSGAAPGENVRRSGEDARPGTVLREQGRVFRQRDAALARAAGIEQAVVRRASITVLVDGVRAPDAAAVLGPVLSGAAVVTCHRLGDFLASDANLLVLASDHADLRRDLLRQADRVIAEGVALRPGEAVRVVILDGRPLVIAPAFLDAVFAVACGLLRPLVEAMTAASPERMRRRGPLTRKLSSSIGVSEVALLREEGGGLEPLAVGALGLQALARADGWLVIPPGSEGHQAGDEIEAVAFLE